MALISIRDLCVGFGEPLLLDRVNLQIERGERVGLLGRNGVGKSTLMRLIHGDLTPDAGEIVRQQGVRIALLPQEVPQELDGTTFGIVAAGLDDTDTALHDDAEWRKHQQVEKTLSRLNLDPNARFDALSAGLKRRVMLARSLVSEIGRASCRERV